MLDAFIHPLCIECVPDIMLNANAVQILLDFRRIDDGKNLLRGTSQFRP